MVRLVRAGVWSIWIVSVAAAAGASPGDVPVLVSPGEPSRFVEVGASCPSFSWAEESGGRALELVVYAVGVDGAWREEPTLRRLLPAGAGSWTPGLGRCLAPGRYAWVVGAAGEEAWSQPRLFEVGGEPSPDELRVALEIVRRHLDAHPETLTSPATDTGPPPRSLPRAPTAPARAPSATTAPSGSLRISGEYLYSTPPTYSKFVGPSDFVSRAGDFRNTGFEAYAIGDQQWIATAHVRLPQGAAVFELECSYADTGPGAISFFRARLLRRPLGSTQSELIKAVITDPPDTSDAGVVGSVTSSAFSETIDNSTHAYPLTIEFSSTIGGTNQTFRGCRLSYTLDRVSAD